MSKIVKYRFHLKSVSPLYFGSNEKGEILKRADETPFITGNSIGGAIRRYLDKLKENNVLGNLGGEEDSEFIESSITISDGILDPYKAIVRKKEGTRLNREMATADDGSKYEFEYLREGTKVSFEIERECNKRLVEKEFKRLISQIAQGFNIGELTLGGQFTNGFGRFELTQLEKREFDLTNLESLGKYIFDRYNEPWVIEDVGEKIEYIKGDDITFEIYGSFPYGVYQNFVIEDEVNLSGIQIDYNKNYYIPSSSLRGLMRSELEKLYNSLNASGETYCRDLFGGKDAKGKLRFNNLILEDAKEIVVNKAESKDDNQRVNENGHATYNKIDRLTGGAYGNSLFSQRNIEGNACFKFTLSEHSGEGYIYPILIILRNIGHGIIPVGGRTSIGLGQFKAKYIKVTTPQDEINIEFIDDKKKPFKIDNREKLSKFKDLFEESLK